MNDAVKRPDRPLVTAGGLILGSMPHRQFSWAWPGVRL